MSRKAIWGCALLVCVATAPGAASAVPTKRSSGVAERSGVIEVRRAIRAFIRAGADRAMVRRFFPEGRMPRLTAAMWSRSADQPVPLGTECASIYRGQIFIDQHYARTSYLRRAEPFEAVAEELFHRQPWLAWDSRSRVFELQRSGAERPLRATLGRRKVVRVTSPREAALFRALHLLLARRDLTQAELQRLHAVLRSIGARRGGWDMRQADRERLQGIVERLPAAGSVGSAHERRALARFVVTLFQQKHCQGPGAAAHGFFAADREIFCEKDLDPSRRRVVRFEIDFDRMPARALRGTYFGIEKNLVEVAFIGTDAKIHAIRHLAEDRD
jgi:hypothetical protein